MDQKSFLDVVGAAKMSNSKCSRGDGDDKTPLTKIVVSHRCEMLGDGHTLHIDAISDLILAHAHTTVFGYRSLSFFPSHMHTPTHSSIVRSVSLLVLIGSMWFLLNTNQSHTWCTALTYKPTICLG